mmetsp:Transcript_7767/g.10728  ORF Transcript_7767/g.10728 Transcript_7767/m.10728 type:complete len:685 (-) Transcript_7767:61-2115(-)|eukprot:CAMPEP_0168564642 /NCGR_PEP_ID=MMETSP0413-20121227/13363_1 /TAXON_ID=136452 /ORGANISM="Filamoeba nolandi, Strain NC-AS-23-1" /LENGTH=684 /DNA_ID=CAMNT_0008596345 /DNA_START=29 /DNA_END=2083 /DNA_ORIENTATION=+
MMKTSFIAQGLLVALILASSCDGADLVPKQLAGPPSEFDLHQIPQPYAGALLQQSAMFPIEFNQEIDINGKTIGVWKHELPVDSTDGFSVTVVSPANEFVDVAIHDPNGARVDLAKHANMGTITIGDGGYEIPEVTYLFERPTVGMWNIKMEAAAEDVISKRTVDLGDGYIILWNNDTFRMYTHLNTYNLRIDNQIGLMTTLTDDETPSPVNGARVSERFHDVAVAEMDIVTPDGTELQVTMHDDGMHLDMAANDMIYGGTIDALAPGTYRASAQIKGLKDGVTFVRTTQHIINVVSDQITFTGSANGVLTDATHMQVQIGVSITGEIPTDDHRAYAEVWGVSTDGTNTAVPVCWISGVTKFQGENGNTFLALSLDLNWLALSNAQAPLQLKNVYIQDADNFVPIDQADAIPVQTPSSLNLNAHMAALNLKVTEITKEMRQGKMPAQLQEKLTKKLAGDADHKGGIILLHGYCSDSNPWETYAEDWTDAYYFINPGASISNDEFAKKVVEFAEQNGLDSFSLVGHSQGGMVATHILNYYWSGIDLITEGRKVQSVGTPYKGATAAGSIADLGNAFGVGCGSNFDLSKDGANLWLGGITTDVRKEVYFYTSTYEQGKFFGDYCNLAVNTICEWPNDGATELDYAVLDGGNNQGNTEKQCHTTGMKYNAQYYDRTRNQQMNSLGGR